MAKDKPSAGAIVERAFSLANEAMFTVELQVRRLHSTEPEDDVFIFRPWADFRFLIVALVSLQNAARTFRKANGVSVDKALDAFDAALPNLRKLRDVAEHIDEYAVDSSKRFHKEIERRSIAVGGWDGRVFSWFGGALDVDQALEAARALFIAIRDEKNRFASSTHS